MNVYAVADLHGYLPPIPEDCDLLLIAGDICPDFDTPYRQAAWLDTTFREWLTVPVVAIWGNHDFVGEYPGLIPDLPWTLLQDSETTVCGLRIYGTPWVPGLPRWAFFQNAAGLQARAELIPEGLNVLMTHGPPKWFGDYIPTSPKQQAKYENYFGEHVGERFLNEAIDRADPDVVLCGHIHEARGAYMTANGVPIFNVAAADGAYEPYPEPISQIL